MVSKEARSQQWVVTSAVRLFPLHGKGRGFESLTTYMTLIKRTTVREYNAECKVTKETVTEEYHQAEPLLPHPWQISDTTNPYRYTINTVPYDTDITDIVVRFAGDAKL